MSVDKDSTDHDQVSVLDVRLVLAAARDSAAVNAAIELGNSARRTLGHMPFEGYREAASAGTLLLAYVEEQIVGYALFGVSLGRVRLTHLCVAGPWRGRGLARRMVEWISHRYSDYLGILANCRGDYGLGPMWIKLGFTQIGQHMGRSKAGQTVISWWLDHHHPNLFTRDAAGVLVRAGLDLNVLRDLVDASRTDAAEAQALIADQISDRLELVRTAALDAEIDQMDATLRGRCIASAQRLTSVRAATAQVDLVRANLISAALSVDANFPRDDQDRFDLEHVAEAAAADLNVFITRDERLASIFGQFTAEAYGLRIVRPVDVVLHIDELARAEAYRPAALLGTNYRRQLIGATGERELVALTNQPAGERTNVLRRTIRDLALQGWERTGFYDPSGRLVAATVCEVRDRVLGIPLVRVASTGLADTIARQVLFQLRQQARERGAVAIRITDRYPSGPVRLAALNDGYYEDDGRLYTLVVDCCAASDEVERQATVIARLADVPPPAPLRSGMPAVAAAELERIWWPAKITDSELPTYLIPIQQRFSTDLLGVPHSLLARNDVLGLAREQVYYRSPAGPRLLAPSRLLWYMSAGGRGVTYPSGIVACSHLDSIHTGTPEDLHGRFRHLGVWTAQQLRNVSRDGQAQALRFTNTEPLRLITLQRLRAIAANSGTPVSAPQGPLRIAPALFAALYEEGRSP